MFLDVETGRVYHGRHNRNTVSSSGYCAILESYGVYKAPT